MLKYIGGILDQNIIVVDAKDKLVGDYSNLNSAYVAAVRESNNYNECFIFVCVLDKHVQWVKHSKFYNGEVEDVYSYKDRRWKDIVDETKVKVKGIGR